VGMPKGQSHARMGVLQGV